MITLKYFGDHMRELRQMLWISSCSGKGDLLLVSSVIVIFIVVVIVVIVIVLLIIVVVLIVVAITRSSTLPSMIAIMAR